MPSPGTTLVELLARFPALFPPESPLVLLPSTEHHAHCAERFVGGHAVRWFAASDGQQGDEPFADAHALCSLSEALEAAKIADQLRSEADGYWVEPHWLAIASDGAGQHLMIDDRDGRILAVAHDDDHVDEIASSPEAWLSMLLDGYAAGSIVWSDVFGLVAVKKLAAVHEFQRAQAVRAKENAQLSKKQEVGLALAVGVTLVLSLAIVWYIEHRR